jgi:cytidyltransferase-like protein
MSIACVSGYFDPIHIGHIEYFKKSKTIADKLMVIVNNDEQAILKKGKPFMPVDERIKIIEELKCVDYVLNGLINKGRLILHFKFKFDCVKLTTEYLKFQN